MRLRTGLRSRIIVTSLVMVVLVVALIGWLIMRELSAGQEENARAAAVGTVADIASELERETPRTAIPTNSSLHAQRLQQVLDSDGQILASSSAWAAHVIMPGVHPAEGKTIVLTVDSLPGLNGSFVVAVRTVRAVDGNYLRAVAAEPTHLQRNALTRLIFILTGVGVLGLVLLYLVIRYSVTEALRPVEVMRRQLDAIGHSGTDRRVDVPEGDDELTALGHTMNDLLDRLATGDRIQRTFITDAGHELGSPLTTVGLLIEQLAHDMPQQHRSVAARRASDEVERLHRIVDDLRFLAASQERTDTSYADDVDLDDIVLTQVEATRLQTANRSDFEIALEIHPARVTGNADQLTRVVRNLLDNGARYATHRMRVTVDSGVGVERSWVRLRVDNDGPPIPPAERRRVFQRFVRLDASRSRETGGTGLGLSIVQRIVRWHGGQVTTGETEAGWCRFEVLLPAQR